MIERLQRRVQALMQRLLRETRGSIALKFALIVPAIAMVSVGAIDLFAVTAAQTRLQAIADAGALAGAPALALATDGAAARERSASFVAGQLSEWSDAPTVVQTYEVVTQGGGSAASGSCCRPTGRHSSPICCRPGGGTSKERRPRLRSGWFHCASLSRGPQPIASFMSGTRGE